MIAPEAGLSVSRQCALLGIARSSFYYRPRPESAAELELLKRLDRIFTDHPVYGSRRLQVALLREGISVGRRRVRRLMRKLGLWAVRPKRNTSERHPGHKVYPYLLRGKTIDRANQVWAADITYIPMRQGFLYLVAIIDWATRRVLSWRLSNTLTAGFCVEALSEALARFGKPGIFNTDQSLPSRKRGGAIHQRGVHQDTTGSWDRDQHGRTRALPRQHLCRALVVDREARMGLLAPGRQRHRTEAQSWRVLRLV
jgi:putative transposase